MELDNKENLESSGSSKMEVGQSSDAKTEPSEGLVDSGSSEKVDFKVVYNKKKYDITFGLDDTVGALKVHLANIIDVPSTMQKIMIKGLAKDEMTLRKLGVVKGSKVMVVGSTLNDVLEVAKKPTVQQLKAAEAEEVFEIIVDCLEKIKVNFTRWPRRRGVSRRCTRRCWTEGSQRTRCPA